MTSQESQKDNAPSLDRFHEIEIEKIFDALFTIQTFRVQIATLFGIANITALGIAFTIQKAGIVLLAALLMLLFVSLEINMTVDVFRYYCRALSLQERFSPNDSETFLSIFASPNHEAQIRHLLKRTDLTKRHEKLRKWLISAYLSHL